MCQQGTKEAAAPYLLMKNVDKGQEMKKRSTMNAYRAFFFEKVRIRKGPF